MSSQFTDRELDVMNVVWRRGSATAGEVRDALHDPLAYNTVLTIMRILEDKGYLRRVAEGRAHRYFALVERREAKSSAVRRLIERLFDGEPRLLATALVDEHDLSDRDVRELHDLLSARLREPRKPARSVRGRRR